MEPYLFRDMLIDLANELREMDESDDEMQNVNAAGGNDVLDDGDDMDDDEDFLKYRNDKVSATENDKNDEVDKMLLSHDKK